MTRLKQTLILILLVLYMVVVPFIYRSENYVLHVFILASEVAIVAMSVRLMNVAGELTFGQVAFVMIGAYSSALLVARLGLSFWIALPISGIIGFLVAILIGLPVLRLRGTYFAILTMIIAEVMSQGARVWGFVGGDEGLQNIPRPEEIKVASIVLFPEFTASDKLPYYYLIAFLLILTLVACWRIERAPLGFVFKAIAQNDSLAESVGIDVRWHRILVFAISAAFSSLAGSFYAHYMTVFYPRSFSVWDSVNYVLYAFIGGIGYLWGPIVGAFGMTWLWEFLHPIQRLQPVIFAVTVIVVIMFLPGGLLSIQAYYYIMEKKLRQRLFSRNSPSHAKHDGESYSESSSSK